MAEFPTHCLRGIRKKEYFVEGTQVLSAGIFEPDPRTSDQRADGGSETSINWEDNATVVSFTLRNRQSAAHGIARLPRQVIEEINQLPNLARYVGVRPDRFVSYERAPLPDNIYHGNLVFARQLPKQLVRLLAGHLAMYAEFIEP
ncbi:MAG: hypothetical protein DYG89_44135 [Caldilinea sp. CFX5]|nr:hypothetical protein [Caldilinea sp. CFX5]